VRRPEYARKNTGLNDHTLASCSVPSSATRATGVKALSGQSAIHRLGRFFAALALAMHVSGCATNPPWKLGPGFASAKPAIHRVLLLPSLVDVYEEQFGYHLVIMPEGSRAGGASLDAALASEAGRSGVELIGADANDPAVAELLDLFVVVDFSIQCHAFKGSEQYFPARGKHFDYRLGDVSELLNRYHADAAMVVTGTNLIPTAGTNAQDTANFFLAIVTGVGMHPVPYVYLPKLSLRAALIDETGEVLYYARFDEPAQRVLAQDRSSAPDAPGTGVPAPPVPDLRDPAYAAKLWPLRTVKYLNVPLVKGMPPVSVGEAVMESRRNDPAADGLRVLGIRPAQIAGAPGFGADYEFRLAPVENLDDFFHVNYKWPPPLDAVQQRKPAYRGRYCGVLLEQWVYGFVYEAPAREYFDRDRDTFDSFLASAMIVQ
jgi:hypothetical protein